MYSMDIRWSEEDGGFIALSPEFEGLSAFGDSVSEAAAELAVALELAEQEFRAQGWALPEPRKHHRHSGQFRLRLPRSLHSWLASAAEHDGVSLNTFVVARMSEARGQRDATMPISILRSE